MRKLSLSKLASELQKVIPKIQPTTEKIVLQSKELKQAKKDEFKRGEKPDGSNIGEYKSTSYRIFKQQKNPLARGKVDLILTGSFTNRIFTKKIGNNTYIFDSSDTKATDLFDKYGQDLKGLNQDTTNEIESESIAEELKAKLKEFLKL